MAGTGGSQAQEQRDILSRVDHLVYAAPDLDAASDRLEGLLGVRASPGGRHEGQGTRNALIALSPESYLEIIAPDPEQPKPARPRRFGIDSLDAPRLVRWAANGTNLEQLAGRAARGGLDLGRVTSGSRKRPDGVLLTWRFTDPATVVAGGIVPFFIDWGQSPHPARTAASGASLISLRAEHPEPARVIELLGVIGIDLPVRLGAAPALVATIRGPAGVVELR
ncbi:MAG: VOC family protein [Acidobacteriota bacterium]